MRFLFLIFFIFGCSHVRVIRKDEAFDCARDPLVLYGDTCQESSIGYEDMRPEDAYYEGVRCASEMASSCIWDKEEE